MNKSIKRILGFLLLAVSATVILSAPAFAEATSMITYLSTTPTAINFTAYYNSDDSKIHTEDSWNDTNANEGYVSAAGACRVSPAQMASDQSTQNYTVWAADTSALTAVSASGTVPSSGTGYTSPGTSASKATLTTGAYLAIPTNVAVSAGSGEAYIKWDQVSGATGYRVYKRPAAGEGASEIVFEKVGTSTSGSSTGVVASGLTNGTAYQFIVVATDSTRRSGHTDEITTSPTSTSVPNITGPSSGTVGSSITVVGSGFGSTAGTVYINGTAVSASPWSDTSITLTIPSTMTTGSTKLVVVTSSGKMDSITFTVNAASATLTSIAVTPATASIIAGTTQDFVATGTYSDSSTAVITSSVTWSSDTTSVATIGSATGIATGVAAGSSTITASLSGKTGTAALTVTAAAPSISSATWESGASYGYVYEKLIVTGSDFTGSGATTPPTACTVEVKFQGGSYTNLSATTWMYWWENGKVEIGIPNVNGSTYAVAGTGTVRISTPSGTTTKTFTLKPKVYSMSPVSGIVGSAVRIEGTAFSGTAASNGVSFNGTSAATGTISRGTATGISSTIEVSVPTGATSGQVLVTVNSQSSNTNYDWDPYSPITFEVTAATTALNITTTSLTAGVVGTAYSKTLAATGGTGTYTWSTTGTLPPGLSINASTGKISGTPTTAGTYSFNAVVTDGTSTDTQALSITISATPVAILDLSTNSLTYTATAAGTNPASQSFTITNEGTASMTYTASESISWLSLNRPSGTLSAGASIRETVSVNIAGLAAGTYTGTVTVESSGGTEEVTISLTVTASIPATTAPEISGLSSSSAYIGQTIIISGSGFGTSGSVSIGGVATSPTSWTDGSITLAVPAGVSAGSNTLSITTSGGTDTYAITVASGSIYIDDYEGGCVGTWSAPDTTTGYYVYGSGITPSTDSTLSTQGPTLDAKYEGSRGMKVKYSYASTGVGYGGWGAVLANNLNISGMNNIKFYLKWDGTSNDYNLVLKDSDGTAVLAQLSSSGLSSSSFTQITVATSEFSYSSTSSDTGANTSFDWSQIAGYGLAYSMTNTTSSYQNFDSLLATYVDIATPYLAVSSTGVSFSTYVGGTTTSPTSNTVTISNSSAGSSSMAYTATCATSWVTLSSASGTLAGGASTNLAVSINLANAPTAAGTYYATIEVASATAQNSPQSITVTLTVSELSGSDPSIGSISESAAPAGTRVILTGTNFGDSQGASSITFTKDGAATVAKTISWNDGNIEVEVPYTLSEGNYSVSINKLTIAAEGINVLSQSDAVSFQVTASSTAGIATIWPNPFNPRTETITIQFDAGTATNIGVTIYDSTARVAKHSLVTGVNQVTWDGKNSAGEVVGDGLYLVRITNEDSKALIAKGKILVVKR